MKRQKWQQVNVLQEAHRIAAELRTSGTATGHSHALDTVRWLMKSHVVVTDSVNNDNATYTATARS